MSFISGHEALESSKKRRDTSSTAGQEIQGRGPQPLPAESENPQHEPTTAQPHLVPIECHLDDRGFLCQILGNYNEFFPNVVRAYAVGNQHRHIAEMQAVAKELGGNDNDILFTPHLLPVARGILATITIPVKEHTDDPSTLWRDCYHGEPFIEIADQPPSLRDVVRRNVVRISVSKAANVRQPTLIIISAIDNLVKGAAGQAVQNANVLLDLGEQTGLPA